MKIKLSGTAAKAVATIALGVLICCGTANRASATLTLAWSAEFNGSGAPGWTYDLGAGGWGNNELETYVNSLANCLQTGGHLQIEAQTDTSHRWYSARIHTHPWGPYGYIEYRCQFPRSGQGYWPAGWMLGNNIGSVGWPSCGEIDVAEEIDGQSTNHQSLHMPGWDPTVTHSCSTGYDSYGAYWQPGYITFSQNGANTATYTSSGHNWPFTKQQFILLNLAIGGNWPGNPNSSTQPNGNYNIDYVRQYNGS